jgi:CubicO group peptidase (beta-lactamase class C family)
MKNIVALSFILLLLSIYLSAYGQTRQEKIDSLITAYYNADCFNGVILVSEKGKIILKKAYGIADQELNVAMTTEMRFRIASISKPFTAMIILQLIDEGFIKLNGKITDYIPDYNRKNGDKITIEQLLTHTSGILQNLDPEKEAIQERLYHSLRDMVHYAEESDLYFEPGTGFHYSNLAYNLLACIAERVTNKPFDRLLTERIFEPLGMKNTSQCNGFKIEKNLSKGYEYKLLSGYENASYFDPSYTVGPGGLITNADDLCKFDMALYNRQLISKDLYNKMFSPTKYSSYGCGWELGEKVIPNNHDTIRIISHSGSINGFGSYIARIESDSILVIVLKNNRSDTYISPAYAPAIGQEIISIMVGEEIQIPKKSIARQIGLIIGQDGIDKALMDYYHIKSTDFVHYNFEESELNKLGIELLFKFNMPAEALKVFEVNMLEFPHSFNTYDSYAYVLMQKGDYVNSIRYYKKGLQILKEFPQMNNNESIQKDAENALKSIKEMEIKAKN